MVKTQNEHIYEVTVPLTPLLSTLLSKTEKDAAREIGLSMLRSFVGVLNSGHLPDIVEAEIERERQKRHNEMLQQLPPELREIADYLAKHGVKDFLGPE